MRLGTPLLVAAVAIALAVVYRDMWQVVAATATLLPVFLGWAAYDYLVTRDGRFVATTPSGVVFRIRSHRTKTIPWHRVIFAEATAYRMPVFKVHHKKRARRIRIHRAIRNCRDGCEFAAAVEDGIQRYASSESASVSQGAGATDQ